MQPGMLQGMSSDVWAVTGLLHVCVVGPLPHSSVIRLGALRHMCSLRAAHHSTGHCSLTIYPRAHHAACKTMIVAAAFRLQPSTQLHLAGSRRASKKRKPRVLNLPYTGCR